MPGLIVRPSPTGPPVQFNITHRTQGWRGLWQTDSGWLSFSLLLTHTKPPVMSGQIKGRILWQWATLLRLVCHAAEWSCGEGRFGHARLIPCQDTHNCTHTHNRSVKSRKKGRHSRSLCMIAWHRGTSKQPKAPDPVALRQTCAATLSLCLTHSIITGRT